MDEAGYTQVMLHIAQGFEFVAAAVLVIGGIVSAVIAARRWFATHQGVASYRLMRQTFGGVLLLGLEILVAGDWIRTVAVDPTLNSVVVLGLIVLIRTFLSFSLEIEIDGVPPWRRGLVSGVTVMKQAVASADGS